MPEISDYFKESSYKVKNYSKQSLIKKLFAAGILFFTSVISCVSVDEQALSDVVKKEKQAIVYEMKNEFNHLFTKTYLPLLKNELKKELESTLDKKISEDYTSLLKQEFKKVIDEQVPKLVEKYAQNYFNYDVSQNNEELKKKVKDVTSDILNDKEFLGKIVTAVMDSMKKKPQTQKNN